MKCRNYLWRSISKANEDQFDVSTPSTPILRLRMIWCVNENWIKIKHEYLRSRAYICLSLSLSSSSLVMVAQLWPLSRYSCCYLGSLHPRSFAMYLLFKICYCGVIGTYINWQKKMTQLLQKSKLFEPVLITPDKWYISNSQINSTHKQNIFLISQWAL